MDRLSQTLKSYKRQIKWHSEKFDSYDMGKYLKKFTSMLIGKKILDFGCGNGRDLKFFEENGFDATGVDYSDDLIKIARQRCKSEIIKMNFLQSLKFKDGSFDGIWASASLLHVPKENLRFVLSEIGRILKPEGVLFVSFKEGDGQGIIKDDFGNEKRFFSFFDIDEIVQILTKNGFGVIDAEKSKDGKFRKRPANKKILTWIMLYCLKNNNFQVHHFKSLISTQDKAKKLAVKGFDNTVVVSDVQSKARGRFKRKWHSSKDGLWMSILIRPKIMDKLQYITFCAAISAARSIKRTTKLDVKIKWPNDLHYKGKKLCGILTEGSFGKENYAIVGIGLNVNQTDFPIDIKQSATSLKLIKKRDVNIKQLSKQILENFFDLYEKYYCENKFEEILQMWKKYSDTIGKEVIIIRRNDTIKGKAVGVDEDCSLLIRIKSKTVKVIEGDVSIRY